MEGIIIGLETVGQYSMMLLVVDRLNSAKCLLKWVAASKPPRRLTNLGSCHFIMLANIIILIPPSICTRSSPKASTLQTILAGALYTVFGEIMTMMKRKDL
jgi:hypothetical protein